MGFHCLQHVRNAFQFTFKTIIWQHNAVHTQEKLLTFDLILCFTFFLAFVPDFLKFFWKSLSSKPSSKSLCNFNASSKLSLGALASTFSEGVEFLLTLSRGIFL